MSSKAESTSSIRSRGKYRPGEFEPELPNQARSKNNDYEDGGAGRPERPGAAEGMIRRPSQKQIFKDR